MDTHHLAPEPQSVAARHNLDGLSLFFLTFKTGLLTFITLGIYRFWQTTRIRKYLWASTSADDSSLEYTGTGLEKFIGFLIALVILAGYLGVFQMVLFYFGLSFFDVSSDATNPAEQVRYLVAFYVQVIAIVPLIFYASYQSRRYMMGRTRWRGIRFSMEKGAWGYVVRAIGYRLLTIVTLGVLAPLATFKLEQYMAERSSYGDIPIKQGGSWMRLYPALTHLFIGTVILLVCLGVFISGYNGLAAALLCVGGVWVAIGFVYYQVKSFAYMNSHKTLGDEVSFKSEPKTIAVIRIYFIAGVGMSVMLLFIGSVMTAIFDLALSSVNVGLIVTVLGYVFIFVLLQAMKMVMITQPILEHFIQTFRIVNPEPLNQIQQRQADDTVGAEGVADALDVAGAF
ncbi:MULTISPECIES: DUF898 family protein [unclassified Halomonas]|uniref:DUF898 family protein n=1 Tax=unclassified Halomonas TaxID=2609666 RepID=UPI0007D9B4B8|nr:MULTISPECIES: DUF898 family protein [unclassified Halomonas]MBT2785772.1 DUF898 family protein [Halomonas sp. ISL-106]MBT2798826.1 DUF898 family protein [Halomonas sp. ISL-104]OAL59188.1 hypothetical protein A6R74_05200 [Halomonas sp. ALS9]